MSSPAALKVELAEASATERLGIELGKLMVDGGCIALVGPLGAGKTTFAKGLGRALGITEVINSPTFTMINEYRSGRLPLYHLDLYRLGEGLSAKPGENDHGLRMLEAELEELASTPGLLLVEWADLFDSYIQHQDHVSVVLNYSTSSSGKLLENEGNPEAGRIALISAHGTNSSRVVDELENVYFS